MYACIILIADFNFCQKPLINRKKNKQVENRVDDACFEVERRCKTTGIGQHEKQTEKMANMFFTDVVKYIQRHNTGQGVWESCSKFIDAEYFHENGLQPDE